MNFRPKPIHLLPLFLLLLLTTCTQPEAAPTHNKKGVHLLLTDTFSDWAQPIWRDHMQAASDAVGEWGYVTQLVRLDDLNVERWQPFMDLCAELKLTPIIRLATTPNADVGGWNAPPADPNGRYTSAASAYAQFVAALKWPTDQHIIIVHNEPNHGNEWGGVVDPAAYARFLIDVADALHAADEQAVVLNAPLDTYAPHTNGQWFLDGPPLMDAESFMDEMFSAEINVFDHIDGWASHPYPVGAFIEPPWTQSFTIDYINGAANPQHDPPPANLHNRGINSYEWELWKLATYGISPLPVYITETGYYADTPRAADYLDMALRGNDGRYPADPQSGWIAWQDDQRVVAITPFAFNGDPSRWQRFNWLNLSPTGTILNTTDLYKTWQASP